MWALAASTPCSSGEVPAAGRWPAGRCGFHDSAKLGCDALLMSFAPEYYDPLSTSGLTAVICRKFEEQPPHSIANLPRFDGAGLYAIYYDGSTHGLYRPLTGYLIPVYVGSAQSHSSATGKAASSTTPLWSRVGQHEKSIDESNLDVNEFRVRLLLMPDVHIDLGENGLRVGYKPVWNSVFRGFGSKEQGSATRSSGQSAWDAAHPGRSRTHGKKRPVSTAAKELRIAKRVIAQQINLCGANKAIDWRNYDPDAITVPKS